MSSPLIFRADFLEPDYILSGGDVVGVCRHRPISFAIGARADGRRVHIHRLAARALANADDPEEAYSEMTVNGKPAVLVRRVRPRPDKTSTEHDDWRLVIVEAFGVTDISAVGLTKAEVLEVAANLP